MKVGFTCGAWDLLHTGHVLFLGAAREQCDKLVVGLHTNPRLDRSDKNTPVQTTFERWVQLKACRFVDEIIPYDSENDLLNLLITTKLDVRFLGSDYAGRTDYTGYGVVKTEYIDRQHFYSSSELRDRVVRAIPKTHS